LAKGSSYSDAEQSNPVPENGAKGLPAPTDDEDYDPPVTDNDQEPDDDQEPNAPDPLMPGRLPREGILKAIALGEKTVAEARKIANEYGKSVRTILLEAGLSVKPNRAENSWNMHQLWYKIRHPKSSDGE